MRVNDTYDSAAEDRLYDDHRQREIDEAREVELAVAAGREARRMGAAAGMNPFISDHEFRGWSRGWSTVDAQIAAEELKSRAKRCRYTVGPCDCGGRGLCLDAA